MEIVDITYLGSDDQFQQYSDSDLSLVNKAFITPSFGGPTDYLELFIKDQAGLVIGSNYNVTKYDIGSNVDPVNNTTNVLYLDPEADAKEQGFNRGSVNVKYNFFRKFINSGPDPRQNFWIKEISTSRTEIKTARQDMSNLELATAFNEFNGTLGTDAYYPDFLLDFGRDIQIIGVNAVYVEEDGQGYIVFKLYEPLPSDFDVKSTFWVVSEVASPAEFNVTINVTPDLLPTSSPLRGPNYKVNVTDKVGKTTPYYNYTSLFLTSVTSSYQQLKSLMDEKGIQINVDYSSFDNFTHFSSVTERLYNFTYKIQQIESASAALTGTNTSTAKITLQKEIDSTIEKFDGYEYYLYFTSASTAWPKSTATQPYTLYSATSSQVSNWLGTPNTTPTATTMSMFYSASAYDNSNKDWLQYATPAYIRDDQNNQPYLVFLDMVGQHFDNVWIYIKDLSNRYSAENNPFVGVSMDQVGDALRSFGISLYTNTSVSDNIYYSLLGINQTGSAYPVTSSLYSQVNIASSSLYPLAGNTYLSSSLSLPPFGDEFIKQYVTTFITASAGVTSSFATLPSEQLKNETYKRLYHNLAYLLKTKGTERGVKALITTYGIPEDILTVNEYGGYNIYDVAGIQEIFNENVITGSVLNISSSLLSPYTTLQYYQNNLDKTSADIEVGFSPTDAINAAITSSGIVTASNQPGYFNIMQLIGAPNQQYTQTYVPLVELEDTFFTATFTGNPQTGLTRFNVWDFIRSIKYYNNSLFKMVRDFVPARANLSSGVIIRSHILERNKYARHEPTVIFEDQLGTIGLVTIAGSAPGGILYDTSYTGSVPVQYLTSSNNLASALGFVTQVSNTGVENYNGQYSGSTIQASPNEFQQVGVSSYIYPTTSSVAPSQHGGQDVMFTTYSLNYLTGNVTGSVISQKFLDLDYSSNQIVPVNYGLITKSLAETLIIGPTSQSQQPYSEYAQLQDYNYYLRRSIQPRYSGSYLSGLEYNVFTTRSAIYSGDLSYGSDPVINYYTNKLGLFTQVQTSSYIPGTVNASLAYFADVSGGLFELNQNNKNWQDLQNIFVGGETLTIKQFDNKKYTNQVGTDGIKAIYNSGYNYTPQLYFNSASDSKLYFEYNGGAALNVFQAVNSLSPNAFISGSSTTPTYAATSSNGYIYNIFDSDVTDSSNYYTPGIPSASAFPTYIVPFAGQRSFNTSLSIPVTLTADTNTIGYTYSVKNNGIVVDNGTVTKTFTSTITAGGYTNGVIKRIQPNLGSWNIDPVLVYGGATAVGPFTLYTNDAAPITVGTAASSITWAVYQYTTGMYPSVTTRQDIMPTSFTLDLNTYLNAFDSSHPTLISEPPQSAIASPSISDLTSTLNLSIDTDQASFAPNDVVTFELQQIVTPANKNYTASVSPGSLTVIESTIQGDFPYATSSLVSGTGSFIDSLSNITGTSNGIINLSTELSGYYGYQFIPSFVSGSTTYTASLYGRYGDVNTEFQPQQFDKVILRDRYGITQDLNVVTSSFSSGTLSIVTYPNILANWAVSSSLVGDFLLLRRYQDEQNIILSFNKNPGQTSYGFLIPNNVTPDVTNNINTLQAAVQSQLLSTQANSTP